MDSYILRIYRRSPTEEQTNGYPSLVGVVETADGLTRRPFHTPQGLLAILVEGIAVSNAATDNTPGRNVTDP